LDPSVIDAANKKVIQAVWWASDRCLFLPPLLIGGVDKM
jgi:hypothetical protein